MSFANYSDWDAEAQREVNPATRASIAAASPILNRLSKELSEFTADVNQLDKLQKQLGTKRDSAALRRQLNGVIQQCNALRGSVDKSLDDLEREAKQNNDPKMQFTEQKLRQQCQEVYKNYQKILRDYNEKLQSVTVTEQFRKNEEAAAAAAASADGGASGSESQPLLGSSGDADTSYTSTQSGGQQVQAQVQVQGQIQGQQQLTDQEVAYQADVIQERDEAITNISKSVQDVNKIFSDLNQIVNQQGEQIDTIEDNMNDYTSNAQQATSELRKADEYQRKKSRWGCMFMLLLIVVLLIVLAIIS